MRIEHILFVHKIFKWFFILINKIKNQKYRLHLIQNFLFIIIFRNKFSIKNSFHNKREPASRFYKLELISAINNVYNGLCLLNVFKIVWQQWTSQFTNAVLLAIYFYVLLIKTQCWQLCIQICYIFNIKYSFLNILFTLILAYNPKDLYHYWFTAALHS